MRRDRAGNAVSPKTAALAFLLLGCGLGIAGLMAGFEPAVLKFGLIAYAAIGGPLLFAAVASNTGERQQSFLPSRPGLREGHRIKTRLWFVSVVTFLADVLIVIAVICLFMSTLGIWLPLLRVLPPGIVGSLAFKLIAGGLLCAVLLGMHLSARWGLGRAFRLLRL